MTRWLILSHGANSTFQLQTGLRIPTLISPPNSATGTCQWTGDLFIQKSIEPVAVFDSNVNMTWHRVTGTWPTTQGSVIRWSRKFNPGFFHRGLGETEWSSCAFYCCVPSPYVYCVSQRFCCFPESTKRTLYVCRARRFRSTLSWSPPSSVTRTGEWKLLDCELIHSLLILIVTVCSGIKSRFATPSNLC